MKIIKLFRNALILFCFSCITAFSQQVPNNWEITFNEKIVNNTLVFEQTTSEIAMDANGNFVIVWASQLEDNGAPDDWDIFFRRYDNRGNELADEQQIIIPGQQKKPHITMHANGNFVIVWEDYREPANRGEIYAQRFDASGNAIGNEILINNNAVPDQTTPRVSSDAAENFVVVWCVNNTAIYYRKFTNNGISNQANETLVSLGNSNVKPDISMNGAGNFAIVWEQNEGNPNFKEVRAKLYNDQRAILRNTFTVNDDNFRDDHQEKPVVAMQANGNFVVVWQSKTDLFQNDDEINTYDGYFQLFDNRGNEIGNNVRAIDFVLSIEDLDVDIADDGEFVISYHQVNPLLPDGNKFFQYNGYESDGSVNFVNRRLVAAVAVPKTGLKLALKNDNTQMAFTWYDNTNVSVDDEIYTFGINEIVPIQIVLDNNDLDENNVVDALIGNLSLDPAANNVVYTLEADAQGPDNGFFQIIGNELHANNTSFNFENSIANDGSNNYRIFIRATDANNNQILTERPFVIVINDINEAPTNISLNNQEQIQENDAAFVNNDLGAFAAVDEDNNDVVTFSFFDDGNQHYNNLFEIRVIGGVPQLFALQEFDFEDPNAPNNNLYRIVVQATDAGGLESAPFEFFIEVVNVNEDPLVVTLNNQEAIAENDNNFAGNSLGDFSATDTDNNDSHTFSFFDDGNQLYNNLFEIRVIGGVPQLFALQAFDFEDANAPNNNLYRIVVQATDAGGLESAPFEFFIEVVNVNEDPLVVTLNNQEAIAENDNNFAGNSLGDFSATDTDSNDSHTFSFFDDGNQHYNNLFEIRVIGGVPQLFALQAFDFEDANAPNNNLYRIVVQATDAGGLNSQPFEFFIEVVNVNEAPIEVALDNQEDISENDATFANNSLGEFTASDEDNNDSHTFSFFDDGNQHYNNLFEIRVIGGVPQLFALQAFDFEDANAPNNNLYRIVVQATDAGGLNSAPFEFFIRITDVFEEMQMALDNDQIEENNTIGDLIGTLSNNSPNQGPFRYSLENNILGPDNQFFQIVGNELRADRRFNFENPVSSDGTNNYRIYVRVVNELNADDTDTQSFTIRITDANDPPFQVSLNGNTVAENDLGFAINSIGFFSTLDEDFNDNHTYRLVGEGDNIFFRIDQNRLFALQAFNYEAKNTYLIKVQSVDLAGAASPVFTFTINVLDINEAPTDIELSNHSIAEKNEIGDGIGFLSTVDEDRNDSHTYTLVEGNGSDDNASFIIVGNQLIANEVFDFETKKEYSIRVRSTDEGGLWIEEVFTIVITDVFERIARIFPNPNGGDFNVNMRGLNYEEVRVLIYDQHGKLRWATRLDNNADQIIPVNPPELAKGVYFVEVIMEKGRILEQLIVL